MINKLQNYIGGPKWFFIYLLICGVYLVSTLMSNWTDFATEFNKTLLKVLIQIVVVFFILPIALHYASRIENRSKKSES